MMSQSRKAKAIRDYFIEVERDYIARLREQSLGIERVEERVVGIVDERMKHYTEQFEDLRISFSQTRNSLLDAREVIRDGVKALGALPLDHDQLKLLRDRIESKGRTAAERLGVSVDTTIPAFYRALNKEFNVPSYHEIPRDRFWAAMQFLRTVTL